MTEQTRMQPISIGLVETVLTSQHVPSLFAGTDTHSAALSFIAQLVPHTQDETLITALVRAPLPSDYRGNTLDEVPGMIAGAIRKGWGEPTQGKGRASVAAIQLAEAAGLIPVRDEHGEPHLGLPQEGGGVLFHSVRSSKVKALLRLIYYGRHNKPLGKEALTEVLDTLEAKALFEGKPEKLHLRFGRLGNQLFIDPGWTAGGFIRITSDCWTIEQDCPIKFYRPPGFQPMPRPVRGGRLKKLRKLLNLDETNWTLLVAFLVNALRPDGPYMFLLVEGEQGSGKSLLCTITKRIIDPSGVEKLRVPKTEHDMMIQASEHHVLVYDNTSSIKWDMSDALCALATGSGFSTRKYYTDNESRSFKYCRPVVMNGIGQYANRPDLLERSIQLQLPSMPQQGRRTEREILAQLDALLPEILGCLLDAAACALKLLPEVEAPTSIRMADAAHWILAAEPALGFQEGSILRHIEGVQHEMMADRVVNDPVVLAIIAVAERGERGDPPRQFSGTVAELLEAMTDATRDDRNIPTHPAHLSNALRRLTPALKSIGITVTFEKRTRKGQWVRISVDEEVEVPRAMVHRARIAAKINPKPKK